MLRITPAVFSGVLLLSHYSIISKKMLYVSLNLTFVPLWSSFFRLLFHLHDSICIRNSMMDLWMSQWYAYSNKSSEAAVYHRNAWICEGGSRKCPLLKIDWWPVKVLSGAIIAKLMITWKGIQKCVFDVFELPYA